MRPKRTSIILIYFLTVLLARNVFAGEDTNGWYPFILDEELDTDSPANVGKLVLDAPAGKHGFVTVKDGDLFFEDGVRARFWGTNLCFSSCFPTKEQAEMIAGRLAFFGFNAVRLHHMDFFFEPNGIFKDIRPGWDDPQKKKTGVLSPAQLDRLDYLIYQLKNHGIYVDMNLLVARNFTKADGVQNAKKFRIAAKPASMFDPKLIELQKQYARDLLTHYNPYTRSRYCDDPVIALVEITNENSIFDFWKWDRLNTRIRGAKKDPIPEYYTAQLDSKWENWLKKKYGDDVRISVPRPIYTSRTQYPQDKIKDIEAFYTDLEKEYFDGMLSFLKKDIGLKAPVTGIGGYPDIHDVEAQENCDFIDKHAYWDHPAFPGSGWDRDNFRIDNKSMLKDRDLGIVGDLKKDMLPNRAYTMTEWGYCYPNQYAYEAPALIASEAAKNNWDGLFQFSFRHMLPDPYRPDNIDSYFDIIANPQQLILMSVGANIFLRQDDIKSTLEPGILILQSPRLIGSAGFIKDKPLSFERVKITVNKDGAVFLYSTDDKPIEVSNRLVLVNIGRVKNQDSGWKNKRFDWGRPPTLLEKIDIEVTLDIDRNFKVYALDQSGTRGKEIYLVQKNNALTFTTQGSNSPWFEIIAE